MTIPFGEDDLNFINSQLSNTEEQINGADSADLTNSSNFSTTEQTFTPFGEFQPTTSVETNGDITFNTTNAFGIPFESTGQQDERIRRPSIEETTQNNGVFDVGTTTITGVTTSTTGQVDEITRFNTGLDTVNTGDITRIPVEEVSCDPPDSFLRCGGQTPYGGIGIYSNGLQNGICSEYTKLTPSCTKIEGTEGTTENTTTGNGTQTTNGETQPTLVCPEGSRQCGPVLTISSTDSSGLCCSINDSCCSTGDSYYCSSGPCSATVPTTTSTTTTGPVGVNPCGGCPPGYECRKAEVGGYQCVNPQEDPCANNGGCGDPKYHRCSYVQGGSPTCIQIKERVVWIACETAAEIEGTPPSNLVQSSDIFGRTCFRQPSEQTSGYRLCGTTDIQNGTPAQTLIATADNLGTCYQQPTTWRQCGGSFQPQIGSPPAGLGLAQDDFGQCYDNVWTYCGNPSFNNRGFPPINYVFNQARNCWDEQIVQAETTATAAVTTTTCTCYEVVSDTGPAGNITAQITLLACGNSVPQTLPHTGRRVLCAKTGQLSVIGGSATALGDCTDNPNACVGEVFEAATVTTQPVTQPTTTTTTQPVTQPTTTTTTQPVTQPTTTTQQETVSIPIVSTPIPTPIPTPVPTPPPTPKIVWRDCVSGDLKDGFAPIGYREVAYPGAGGGTCWEPQTIIGFSPSLDDALYFTHQRGTGNYPQPKTITATNPSYAISYNVKITTNPNIILTPSAFILEPRSSVDFIVNVTPELIGQLGDGKSTLSMTVEIKEL